jgi:hypothetical protein
MKKEKCIGCKNIEEGNFPFTHSNQIDTKEGFWIDTEGCGEVQNLEDYYLRIFYCPVCGKKLR